MFKKKISKVLIATLLSSSLLPMMSVSPISASTQAEQTPVFSTNGQWPALSPDGKTVLIGKGQPDENKSSEYLVDMYDVQTGSLLKEIKSNNNSNSYEYSPNGKYLVSSGNTTNFLDGKTGDQLFSLKLYNPRVAFQQSNDDIAGFTYSTTQWQFIQGNTLDIFDLKTQKLLFKKTYDSDQTMNLAIHPTEPIVAASHGRDIDIINYETGKTLKTLVNPFGVSEDRSYFAISSLFYSPDGKTLSVMSNSPVKEPFKQYDAYGNPKADAIHINPYINEPAQNSDALPARAAYSPDKSQIFLYYLDKIKRFDAQTGEYKGTIGEGISEAVFSNDMNKIAYYQDGNTISNPDGGYVRVQDFPIAEIHSSRIEFRDPYIQLRQGQSTYYGLDYIDNSNQKTLLDPKDVTLEPMDNNIVEMDSSNKIIAKNPGSTIIKATYQGMTAYLSIEVQNPSTSRIVVDNLYDSSMVITGTAPPNVTLYANGISGPQSLTTNQDGSFTFNLDKPLKANSSVRLMYYLYDVDPAEAAPNSFDYNDETVLRDTVAPQAPVISSVDQDTGVIQGKTEPYATVTVSAENSQPSTSANIASIASTAIKSIKTGSTGAFKLQMNAALSGKTLKSTAKDLVGNTSKPTITKVADKTPPIAPSIQPVSSIATTVSGKTEPYAVVYIKKGSALLAKGTAGSTGSFSIKIPVQAAGTTLSITAQDAAKNASKATTTTVVKAPATPTASSISDKTTTVTGKAQAHTTVYIKKGTTILGSSSAASTGSYTIHMSKQHAGTILSITAKTSSGVYSAEKKVTVKDLTPPSVPTVNPVYSTSTIITGKTELYAKIKVYRSSTLLGTASASKTGTWKLAITKQKRGTSLKIYAYDNASNRSAAKTLTVK
jgi:hypothetical protein